MNAKAQRAEYKRRRTVAIKKLREAGMSEAEIQQELLQVREELGLNQASNDETEDSAGGDPSTGSAIDGGVNGLDRLPAVISRDHESQSKAKQSAFVQWSEEWWAHSKPEVRHRRCKAHTSRDGSRCRNISILGATVCRYHGGATKHVKQAARARIENASEQLAKALLGMALDPNMTPQVKLNAIRDALDRGGLKTPTEVAIGSPGAFEEIFSEIAGGTRDAYRNGSGFVEGLDDSPGIEFREFDTSATDYANYSDETPNARPSRGQDGPTRHPATWADGDSDPLGGPPAADQAGSRASARARQSMGSEGPAPVTGEEAIRRANIANGLIDPEVFGLPPGRGY